VKIRILARLLVLHRARPPAGEWVRAGGGPGLSGAHRSGEQQGEAHSMQG
jgi:hypothetical protein